MSGRLVGNITRTQTRLTPTEKLIFVILGEHVRADDGGGFACPSVETIASHAEVSTRTVKRALKCLREKGWIRVIAAGGLGGRRYTSTKYAVLPQPSRGDMDVTPTESRGDIHGTLGVTPVSPDPEVHPEKQKSSTSTVAPSAPGSRSQGGRRIKTAKRPLESPTVNQLRKAIWDVLKKNPPGNDPDVADAVAILLAERGLACDDERIRRQLASVRQAARPRELRPRTASRALPLVGATPRRAVNASRQDDPVHVVGRAHAACQHATPCPDSWSHCQLLDAESGGDPEMIAGVRRLIAKRASESTATTHQSSRRATA